jgi:hypothetical protein
MNISVSDNSGLGDNLARFTKEPPMRVLTGYDDCFIGENTRTAIVETSGDRARPRITPPMLQRLISIPPARIVKILEIRERLALGVYDIDERMDAVLDRILADIKT